MKKKTYYQTKPDFVAVNEKKMTDTVVQRLGISKAIIGPIVKLVFKIFVETLVKNADVRFAFEDKEKDLRVFFLVKKFKDTKYIWVKEGEPTIGDNFIQPRLASVFKTKVAVYNNKEAFIDHELIRKSDAEQKERIAHMESIGYEHGKLATITHERHL